MEYEKSCGTCKFRFLPFAKIPCDTCRNITDFDTMEYTNWQPIEPEKKDGENEQNKK